MVCHRWFVTALTWALSTTCVLFFLALLLSSGQRQSHRAAVQPPTRKRGWLLWQTRPGDGSCPETGQAAAPSPHAPACNSPARLLNQHYSHCAPEASTKSRQRLVYCGMRRGAGKAQGGAQAKRHRVPAPAANRRQSTRAEVRECQSTTGGGMMCICMAAAKREQETGRVQDGCMKGTNTTPPARDRGTLNRAQNNRRAKACQCSLGYGGKDDVHLPVSAPDRVGVLIMSVRAGALPPMLSWSQV